VRRKVKGLLGQTLFASRLSAVLLRDAAVIVAFHRVQETAAPDDALTIDVEMFEQFCRYFSRHFKVVSLSRIVQKLAEVFQGRLKPRIGFCGIDAPPTAYSHVTVLPNEPVRGRQLLYIPETCSWSYGEVPGIVRDLGIGFVGHATRRQNRLRLAGKQEGPSGLCPIEGLYADAISRREQATVAAVPNRERKHSIKAIEKLRAPRGITRQNNFGVALRTEWVSQGLEMGA